MKTTTVTAAQVSPSFSRATAQVDEGAIQEFERLIAARKKELGQ